MNRHPSIKHALWGVSLSLLLSGCGATQLVSTPIENIDSVPLKVTALSDAELHRWQHTDLRQDTIPGMSVDRAYSELIGNRKGKTVIVAVLDTGMDLDHEDLDDVLWTNRGERPGNGIDDDGNGYVDDIHGYNFIGESYHEQLEMARILRLGLGDAALQQRARATLEKESAEIAANKRQLEQILQAVRNADSKVKAHLGKEDYTEKELGAIRTEDAQLQQSVALLKQMYAYADSIPEMIEELKEGITYFSNQLNYHYNVEFDGREGVGDNPYNLEDTAYGNGNPESRADDETHATHVAGIIAAERGNGIGMDGVARNVQIMSVRMLPDGDEYDKDVALAVRYAVDNGARVINASFGKAFSPNAEWVYDAIRYAAANDVLIVHAAGNEGLDLDLPENPNYPNDQEGVGQEISDNVITVGSLEPSYGSQMVSSFSNYGTYNVDIFAPGGEIYSTYPGNKYKSQGGTSMAAPAISGIAAMIRSLHPSLSASQVKKIIMQSGLAVTPRVILGGNAGKTRLFGEISKSGRMANLYNALIMAEKWDSGSLQP